MFSATQFIKDGDAIRAKMGDARECVATSLQLGQRNTGCVTSNGATTTGKVIFNTVEKVECVLLLKTIEMKSVQLRTNYL